MKLDCHIESALKDEDSLNVFGLILFTNEHPHIIKVLRDDDYWRQFDSLSGECFTVFSARPAQGRYQSRAESHGTLGKMRMVWQEPSENEELLTTFGLDNTKDLPAFLVFARLQNDEVAQCSLSLTDLSEEAAHQRLKEVIAILADAANRIAEEYRMNTEDVFNAFSQQIREFKQREVLFKAIKWIPLIGKIKKYLISP